MKKLLNKKGFTLMEMLIVVAIIVILVSISIPAFSGSLDSAKEATDAANFRAAKAALVMQTMAGADNPVDASTAANAKKYYYDFETGQFEDVSTANPAAADVEGSTGECSAHSAAYIGIADDGKTVVWKKTADHSTVDPCGN